VLGLRADELDVMVGEDFSEARIFGEEAVTRVHCVSAGDFAGGEDRRDVEIAVLGRRRADTHALVGKAHVHGVGIGGGVHRNGGNAEFLAGAQHAQRDLAAIGDEDLIEHFRLVSRMRCSASAVHR
jgi:hypothetical protein